jgi:hypothetical protein
MIDSLVMKCDDNFMAKVKLLGDPIAGCLSCIQVSGQASAKVY